MPRSHAQLEAVMAGDDRSVASHLTRAALRCAQPFYYLGLRLDQRCKAARAQPLGRPVVSVGNLTAGGTGKTPFTVDLVRRLQRQGHRPAVLTRGYRPGTSPDAADAVPDETEMLRATLGDGVPVEANPSRVAGASIVLQHHPDTTCFVLDDGFQHRQAQRDLDLVLIDATKPFGHGHLLPRGLLREPLGALRRADAVLVTRADQVEDYELDRIERTVTTHHGRPPLARTAGRWRHVLDTEDREQPVDSLNSRRVHAVCAIGNPVAFLDQLRRHAGDLVGSSVFNDHHAYTHDDVARVVQDAQSRHADALVLTEKDWGKWNRALGGDAAPLPVLRPVLGLEFVTGEDAMNQLLQSRVPRP